MAREIKFRGKRSSNSKWVYGAYIPPSEGQSMPHIYDLQTDEFIEIKPGTEGQYIGTKDRHGVDIYENDVVATEYIPYDGDASKYKPVRRNTVMRWREIPSDHPSFEGIIGFGYEILYGAEQDMSNVEVVGNICDNPELSKLE